MSTPIPPGTPHLQAQIDALTHPDPPQEAP